MYLRAEHSATPKYGPSCPLRAELSTGRVVRESMKIIFRNLNPFIRFLLDFNVLSNLARCLCDSLWNSRVNARISMCTCLRDVYRDVMGRHSYLPGAISVGTHYKIRTRTLSSPTPKNDQNRISNYKLTSEQNKTYHNKDKFQMSCKHIENFVRYANFKPTPPNSRRRSCL